MKIAVLSPFYPYRGGIAQFSMSLYRALAKEHEVKVFSFSRLYPGFLFPGKTQFVEGGEAKVSVSSERILDSINPFSYERTAKAIEKYQPDVLVIAYWMSFFAPAYGHIAHKLRNKTRIIALVHNAVPHEPKFYDKPLSKLFFNQVDGFMVLSEPVKKDLLSLYPHAKYCLCAHPLYNHFGEKQDKKAACEILNLNPGKKTLLFFGLIRDYKGLDLLIQAMSFLDDSYQLIIAGEFYGDFGKYRQIIDVSPAKYRIQVRNQYIADEEVPVLFSAADALVLPYKSATQSGVVPVAYHFEIPIVATGVGSLKDTIETAGTGIVVRPEAVSIAGGIQQLFSEGMEKFIANIRIEKQKLSWEVFAQALIDFSRRFPSFQPFSEGYATMPQK
ncbi:MAG: glycosyltransferase [Candidatus Symbiothrix sp.]|jgi:glycosyltransferase involved in cell wall biosynthesis|nr:glycosyltransferase [Candidatus Symbiothrix sp.]